MRSDFSRCRGLWRSTSDPSGTYSEQPAIDVSETDDFDFGRK